MRTRTSPTETVTISLPRAMRKTLDELRVREHRTTSELVREALRVYAATRATYTPTATELRAIAKGRASESMTLDNFFSHVETLAKKSRRQDSRPSARKRA
jgi:Arc/MetJ-type ribon-helix-helix transcriptional regulator